MITSNLLDARSQLHVVIVPHPDDEVLGFGGLISRLVREGNQVHVIIVFGRNTARGQQQQKDAFTVQKVLGYTELTVLNLDSNCDTRNLVSIIENRILQIINLHGPIDGIWTVGPGDNHQDHAKLFSAITAAMRPAFMKNVHAIYAGEVISSADQAVGAIRCQFIPNTYIVLTMKDLDCKIETMSIYTGEASITRNSDHITTYAKKRGGEANAIYAEAFMLLRSIE